eukprot:gene21506-28489_t
MRVSSLRTNAKFSRSSAATLKPSRRLACRVVAEDGPYSPWTAATQSSTKKDDVLEVPDIRSRLSARPSPFTKDNYFGGGFVVIETKIPEDSGRRGHAEMRQAPSITMSWRKAEDPEAGEESGVNRSGLLASTGIGTVRRAATCEESSSPVLAEAPRRPTAEMYITANSPLGRRGT